MNADVCRRGCSLETHRNSLILRDEFFGRRLQCGTGLPACQRLTCVAPGTAIQVSPPNERRRPSTQVASQKPSCFVGQPILANVTYFLIRALKTGVRKESFESPVERW